MMQQGDAGPALWSAEEPNLYILVLSLIAPDGSHVESESCQVRSPKQKNQKAIHMHINVVFWPAVANTMARSVLT